MKTEEENWTPYFRAYCRCHNLDPKGLYDKLQERYIKTTEYSEHNGVEIRFWINRHRKRYMEEFPEEIRMIIDGRFDTTTEHYQNWVESLYRQKSQ